MSLPKPQLRNLLLGQIKKNIIGLTTVSLLSVAIYKFLVIEPRKKQYQEFYKNYDPEKQLKIMNEAGLMQSHPL